MFKHDSLVRSAIARDGCLASNKEVVKWIRARNEEVGVAVERTRLSEMVDWSFDPTAGLIKHHKGRFFTIEGLSGRCSVDGGKIFSQPIINQAEIGFLGCLVREFEGVLHFLVQSKIEPGNINVVQLSPTLQATRSNYTQQHGGRTPKFLDMFVKPPPQSVVYDQLQSEQGSRFLRKRNRNFIVYTEQSVIDDEDFRWLTLGQIKSLCRIDNMVNMDLRTVISGLNLGLRDKTDVRFKTRIDAVNGDFARAISESATYGRPALHSFIELQSWITELKATTEVAIERTRIDALPDWEFADFGLTHRRRHEFDVDWVNVAISNREVSEWNQPILRPNRKSLFAFVTKSIDGILHFLTQAKFEFGNLDMYEIGPTVQCYLPDDDDIKADTTVPFVKEVLTVGREKVRLDVMQSEEGGRFYKDENRNMVVEVGDEIPLDEPLNFRWMTLTQIQEFSRFSNNVNIQARSLIAMLEVG